MLKLSNSIKEKLGRVSTESNITRGVLYLGMRENFSRYDLGLLTTTLCDGLNHHLRTIVKKGFHFTVDAIPFRRPSSWESSEHGESKPYIFLIGERRMEIMNTIGYIVQMKTRKGSALAVLIENETERLTVRISKHIPKRERLYTLYHGMMS
ncbi:hypothetical protein HOL21_02830 [Candidatus Woesearchaeota archaeon]|mgnify:CR=1 FL=1|jgi:hypothetical protein|nr:hypothetical protein [Candidatus Woesearchaeota archaeon]MBT5397123.1 hypothetical protein [Candidatus Woesearchaeota archaeon]MBT5924653.1 hypothetical protein [Candidatus Woesearchaeota archaeon]MBT6367331.1 hypothetical protein [Candidatus Woesearchaeota archaeon]MBT7762523.1 hypothetical protein [Candidatus Woesearchaeota archaeon]